MLVKWANNVYVYDTQEEQKNHFLFQTECLLSALSEDGTPT